MGRREPLALLLYRRYLDGESIAEIAAALAIPEDRVGLRIRAAALYAERLNAQEDLAALGRHLRNER